MKLITFINNSFINLTLISFWPLSLKDIKLKQKSSFIFNLININDFDNIITLKPWYDELKMELDKEKSYKVRALDIYRKKNLNK